MSSVPWLAAAIALLGWRALPLAGIALGLRWIGRRGRSRADAGGDIEAVALLVLSGLRAGLSLAAAMSQAADLVRPAAALELHRILRRGRLHGLAPALAEATGNLAPFAALLARTTVTGASPSSALAAFLEERRSVERARTLEAARSLPVRLVVPVALLLLPGTIALTMGPALAAQLEWLLGGVWP